MSCGRPLKAVKVAINCKWYLLGPLEASGGLERAVSTCYNANSRGFPEVLMSYRTVRHGRG